RFGFDFENRIVKKDEAAFARAVDALQHAKSIRFSSMITNEEAEHVFEEKIQFTPSRWDEGDLEEFVEKNFLSADLTEYFDGFSIIKEGKEKINGNDAIWFIANFNVGQEEATSFFYFIKMFNRVISITTFCMTEDFELKYKIKYLEIIRSTKSYLDSKGKNRR
ncbi:MAG: hypothetical protein RBT05_07965, partial [Bacteroidales bacterium]|nr:hypothetical protein [Bacteroidales bacterium]